MASNFKNREIIYHIARTRHDLEQAFSLVYKEYASRGYIPKHYKSTMRISLYNALPFTATFVAKEARKVVATVTLIPDSPLGLPMDKIYQKEVDSLRKEGRRVAEVSQLSVDSELFPKNWFSMFNFNKLIFVFKLFKVMLDYALYQEGLTDLCIAVNPRHQYLYKFLAFEELGGLKYYGNVNKAPAVARRLNLEGAEEKAKQRRGLYKVFFGKKTSSKVFKDKFILSESDLKYFFVKKSDIFKKAAPKQLNSIKTCYPNIEFKKLLLR